MTPTEIRAAVAANPALQALGTSYEAASQIAVALSTGRTKLAEKLGGYGLVMDTLGATAGAELLDTITAVAAQNRAVYWGLKLLDAGNLNFGSAQTQAQLDALVSAGVPQASIGAMKAVAVVPDPVSTEDVYQALQGAA